MQLKTYLKRNDITTRQFAESTGISAMSISRYARRLRVPTLEIASRIVDATQGKVTFRELMDIKEQK